VPDNLFRNRYLISSSRLKVWDYASPGYYFVTICTKNRQFWFGEVRNSEISLSAVGRIVVEELLKTPQIRPNVDLDAWVVMPNHMHVIFVIKSNAVVVVETPRWGVSTTTDGGVSTTTDRGVSTTASQWKPGTLGGDREPIQSKMYEKDPFRGGSGFRLANPVL
jgi:putative transposase